MKKLFALLLALAMVGSIALADPASLTDCSVSSGVVNAVNYVDITAPFSGTLQPFTWEAGDLVNAGDLLFSMRTTTIYATEDATVQAIYCAAGDDAAAVATRYGGLIAMRGGRGRNAVLPLQQGRAFGRHGARNDGIRRGIHGGGAHGRI